jgi:hypothetical protein
MEWKLRGERPRGNAAAPDDERGRVFAEAGMLVFLIGLALLFVANAPS